MASGIDYKVYMNRALRRVMADALSQIAEDGLPGEHHLLISFETDHPGVDIPDWLSEKYPEEMQIVLQHWFDDLAVMDDRFSVVLNFSETPQTLVVPFAAVRSFVDPSVEFGLRFDPEEAPAARRTARSAGRTRAAKRYPGGCGAAGPVPQTLGRPRARAPRSRCAARVCGC